MLIVNNIKCYIILLYVLKLYKKKKIKILINNIINILNYNNLEYYFFTLHENQHFQNIIRIIIA